MRLALPARAKLNLELEVTGRRADGFHDVRTTLQAIDVHDLLEIEPAADTTLTAQGLEVVTDARSTVLIAQRELEAAAGRRLPAAFHLHKRIPTGAGMGGASSDAAAALRGLAALHDLDVRPVKGVSPRIDLFEVARTVGADVPFFLAGGRARAEGRGDVLSAEPSHDTWFVVAWPGFAVLTADVYAAWDSTGGEPPNCLRRAAETVEPRLKEFAATLGEGWRMTGSGSAFFKSFAAEQAAHEVASRMTGWRAVAHTVGAW